METNLQGKSTESNFHEFKKKNLRRREGGNKKNKRKNWWRRKRTRTTQAAPPDFYSVSVNANFASQSKQIS